MALSGAIALAATVAGRKVRDVRDTRTNLQLNQLGPSGSGKNHARDINIRLLHAAGCDDLVGPSRFSSGQGVIKAIEQHPVLLFQPDEFHSALSMIAGQRSENYQKLILDILKELSTSAHCRLWRPTCLADIKQNVAIDQPHAVTYATAIPELFWHSVASAQTLLTDGYLGRQIIFADWIPAPDATEFPTSDPPQELVDRIRWWSSLVAGGNLAQQHPSPLLVRRTDQAQAAIKQHMEDCRLRQLPGQPVIDALWSRAAEKTAQLSLTLAASRQTGHASQQIELEDVQMAIRIVEWSTLKTIYCLQSGGGIANRLAMIQKLNNIIPVNREISAKQLGRATLAWMDKQTRERLLEEMEDAGLLKSRKASSGKGRPGKFYQRIDASHKRPARH